MKILNAGIHLVFRGLKFESDAVIGQKGSFCKGLKGCSFDNTLYYKKIKPHFFCYMKRWGFIL